MHCAKIVSNLLLEVNQIMVTLTAVGPRSEALVEEIEGLQVAHTQTTEEINDLVQVVSEREDALNRTRAAGVMGEVNGDVLAAFEAELEELQNRLAEKRSVLCGLDGLLATKTAELEVAQATDAEQALLTAAMSEALAGLKENAEALDATRTTLVKSLEKGAEALLRKLMEHRDRWGRLIEERQDLYVLRYKALGSRAGIHDSAYYKMMKDRHVVLFSGDGQEVSRARELAELLRPLIQQDDGRRRR
jgi:hypothetical protein